MQKIRRFSLSRIRKDYLFFVLSAFLVLVFLTGGGARADIQSLVALRPAAIIVLAIGIWGIKWHEIRSFRVLYAMATAVYAILIVQLVPLPPAIWRLLPGRDIIAETDAIAQLGNVWRPMSMVPSATWNAFFALMVPMAGLTIATRLDNVQRAKLLTLMLALGLGSGLLGLLQAIGPNNGPLYLYKITNNGAAVGLFANRNHQATLLACLFPMMAAFASIGLTTSDNAKFRKAIAICAGLMVIPMILVTGSRAGLIVGLVGLLSVPFVYRRTASALPTKRKSKRLDLKLYLLPVAVIGIVAVTYLMSRAEAINRLTIADTVDDLRFKIIEPMLFLIWKYFPFGTGFGTFLEVFQIDEPRDFLTTVYVNHAHNDWLETILTGGVGAVVLMIVALLAWARTSWNARRQPTGQDTEACFTRLGCVVTLILAISSGVDYPLRVPTLALIFVIASVWMTSRPYQPPDLRP
jgi:O-antigen ligase